MPWRTSTVAKSANCIRINQATIAVKLCKTPALHSHRNVSNAAWNNKCAESPGAASNLKRLFNKREESIFGSSASFWPFYSSVEWVISKLHSDASLVNAAAPKPIQATTTTKKKTDKRPQNVLRFLARQLQTAAVHREENRLSLHFQGRQENRKWDKNLLVGQDFIWRRKMIVVQCLHSLKWGLVSLFIVT